MTNQELIAFALRFLAANLDHEVYQIMLDLEDGDEIDDRAIEALAERLRGLNDTVNQDWVSLMEIIRLTQGMSDVRYYIAETMDINDEEFYRLIGLARQLQEE